MAGAITTSEAAKLLIQTWSATLKPEATEEMKIGLNFSDAEGVEKFRNQLNIRKIKVINGTTAAANFNGQTLVYTNNTENAVSCTPTWAYAAVEITRAVFNRMEISPANGYRDMIRKALATAIDVACAQLASTLTTNVKGSGASQIDKSLLLDLLQALVTTSRNQFKPGITPVHLTIHPSQLKNLISIIDITADYARGDDVRPLVSGWVSKALGINFNESGNVYQSGGVTHNIAHIDGAFVLAYNEEPTILDPQDFELLVRLIATTEHGEVAVFDEWAADLQTAA